MDITGMDGPALPDTAMMDGTIDDLFGEAADEIDVSLPPPPLPAALVSRVAEMQALGCCTKLAWSNIGSIALISADGKRISFYAMVRDRKSRMWALGDESKTPILAPEGRRFTHIQFNGVGIDLAATDHLGVVHMYTLTGPLGKMHVAAGSTSHEERIENESSEVVGMHWLPLYPAEFRALYIDPANKVDDRWEAMLRQRDQTPAKAHHPADGRHALLHVSRTASVTLLYQNEGHGWQSTSVDFSPIPSSQDLISHAALGEDGPDVLMVTYDLASRLRLYRITINWNPSQHSRPPNTTYTLVAPTLSVAHVAELEGIHANLADSAGLTHLCILPAVAPSMSHGLPSFPTIVAIFTHAPATTDTTTPSNCFSIITRWHAEPLIPILHESFSKLKSGADMPIVANPIIILRRQPEILTNKIILCIQTQSFDTLIALGASDGSMELRDRLTLESLEPNYGDTTTAATLPQSGFEHLAGDHHVHVAMSADASGLAFMRTDRKLTTQVMSFRYGWQVIEDGLTDNKPFVEAAAVCVARQFGLLLYHNITSDETLALIPVDATEETRSLVIKMIFRVMSRSPDVSMHEPSKQQIIILREPLVPRILSAQLAMGTDLVTGQRNFAAQFAFAMLNLRLVGTALAQTIGRTNIPTVEATHSLRGLVKWSTELIIFIVATLVKVQRDIREPKGTSVKDAFQQIISESGNPALHLLLCSFSRAFLRFQIVWLNKYLQILQAAIPRARSATERTQLNEVFELTGKLPFNLGQFENVVSELNTSVVNAYTQGGISAERRSDIEIALITDGVIPPELENSVNSLMDNMLPRLCDGTDMDRLCFWQTEWLGLANSTPPVGGTHHDVIRKIPLPKGTPLRRCRRCGSEMEDIAQERLRELPGWFPHAQRHCVCTNYWLEA